MSRKLPLVLLLACGAWLGVAVHAAEEEAGQEATFELTGIEAKDAATLVRTIAGIRELRLPDEKTLVIQGTADDRALVTSLLDMAAAPGGAASAERLPASDGSVVVAVLLERAAPADVMTALRQLRVARVVAMEDGRMFLRDTEGQIEAALALVGKLDGAAVD
jgi:hypothetical protein